MVICFIVRRMPSPGFGGLFHHPAQVLARLGGLLHHPAA